jgi:phage FluMu protein gp41
MIFDQEHNFFVPIIGEAELTKRETQSLVDPNALDARIYTVKVTGTGKAGYSSSSTCGLAVLRRQDQNTNK